MMGPTSLVEGVGGAWFLGCFPCLAGFSGFFRCRFATEWLLNNYCFAWGVALVGFGVFFWFVVVFGGCFRGWLVWAGGSAGSLHQCLDFRFGAREDVLSVGVDEGVEVVGEEPLQLPGRLLRV